MIEKSLRVINQIPVEYVNAKIKAFKINEIQNPSVTEQSFTPRYKIEL